LLRYDERRKRDWKVGQRAPDVALAELEARPDARP